MEMKGVSENGMNSSEKKCSICHDMIINAGLRSLAILQCGHEFHLDCIGSAFNSRGEMQCPNCRVTEAGQWLYSRGPTISAPQFSMVGASLGNYPYFFGFPEMSFGRRICPFQGLTQASPSPWFQGLILANPSPLVQGLTQANPSPLSSFGLMSSVTPMGNHYQPGVNIHHRHGWPISFNPAPFHHHQPLAQGLHVPLSTPMPMPMAMPLSVHVPVPMPTPVTVPMPVPMPVSGIVRRIGIPRSIPRFMPSQQRGQASGSSSSVSPNCENPPMNPPPS